MGKCDVLLRLEAVSKRYSSPAGGDGPLVLDGLDLEVTDGDSLAVVGPSGSGKSTLLNLIGALDSPTAGRVLLSGEDLAQMDEMQLARLRNRQIGFVFQLHHLLPQCTVLENVLIPTLAGDGSGSKDAEPRAQELLDRVGLADVRSHRPGQISGGQRQRVAVVRALINRPKLLLADEPTGSLDRPAAEDLAELLAELNRRQGVTLIVVTHSMALAGRMDRMMMLREGRLEAAGAAK